jgi:hypothetical protein
MTKHERRRYFERLVYLRILYQIRGWYDSDVAISIDETLAYVERLMGDSGALAEALGSDLSDRPRSTVPESDEP